VPDYVVLAFTRFPAYGAFLTTGITPDTGSPAVEG
jgi:hypothetical protein